MRAIILTGGRGKRLMPLTQKTKKAYLPLGNRRVVDFIIDRLPEGIQWSFSENDSGAIAAVVEAVKGQSEPILIIAGDNYFSEQLDGFISAYSDYTLIGIYDVKSLHRARNYGVVILEEDGRQVRRVFEKPKHPLATLVLIGLFIFPERVFDYIEEMGRNRPGGNLGEIVQYILKREPVYCYRLSGLWFDIGTEETYREALEAINE